MKLHRTLIGAALALLLAAPALEAQDAVVLRRGMLGIRHEAAGTNRVNARQRVVTEVVPGSPAERAGLTVGDTILSINGLAATAQVMSAPFEPGDTVRLRVRRDGRERDVRLVAERSERVLQAFEFALPTLPDSVIGNVSVIMERIRGEMDSTRALTVRLIGADSVITIRSGDTTRVLRLRGNVDLDFDSVRVRGLRSDSMHVFDFGAGMRVLSPDSAHAFAIRALEGVRFPPDSFAFRVFSRELGPDGRPMPDREIEVFSPRDIFASGMSVGMRSIGGAELSDLNPGLAEYFGSATGVLVLNARPGTPAGDAGLRGGDVVLQVNGRPVASIAEMRRAVDALEPGTSVRLRVLRRGQNVDIDLRRL